MPRPGISFVSVMALIVAATSFDAWCVDSQVLQLEMMKKKAQKDSQWVSQGAVHKSDVPGFYRHWPGDGNAFWLKSDGTGLLYGGQRGAGTFHIMWDFHEDKSSTLCIRSVQLKREYKVIRKDGKVWMIEGREIWRQHVSMNAKIRQPRDRARKIGSQPPKALQKLR